MARRSNTAQDRVGGDGGELPCCGNQVRCSGWTGRAAMIAEGIHVLVDPGDQAFSSTLCGKRSGG